TAPPLADAKQHRNNERRSKPGERRERPHHDEKDNKRDQAENDAHVRPAASTTTSRTEVTLRPPRTCPLATRSCRLRERSKRESGICIPASPASGLGAFGGFLPGVYRMQRQNIRWLVPAAMLSLFALPLSAPPAPADEAKLETESYLIPSADPGIS